MIEMCWNKGGAAASNDLIERVRSIMRRYAVAGLGLLLAGLALTWAREDTATQPATQPAGLAILLPGSRLSVDRALKEHGTIIAACCEAMGDPTTYQYASQQFKVLEGLAGTVTVGRILEIRYVAVRTPAGMEQEIRKGQRVIWIAMSYEGEPHLNGLKAIPDTLENRKAVKAAATQPASGPASAGRRPPQPE